MSATALKSLTDRNASRPGQLLLQRLGVAPRHERCPFCDSIIYSRRHSQCGVCEQELPASVRFSGVEAAKVDRLLETERRRHRAWLLRIEEGRD